MVSILLVIILLALGITFFFGPGITGFSILDDIASLEQDLADLDELDSLDADLSDIADLEEIPEKDLTLKVGDQEFKLVNTAEEEVVEEAEARFRLKGADAEDLPADIEIVGKDKSNEKVKGCCAYYCHLYSKNRQHNESCYQSAGSCTNSIDCVNNSYFSVLLDKNFIYKRV